MPVLEAMASGLAVVATRCLGLNSFAHHLVNCLLADPQVSPTPPTSNFVISTCGHIAAAS